MLVHRALAALLAAGALGLASCGDAGSQVPAAPEAARAPAGETAGAPGAAADLEHVHGLGVRPSDGTLFVATHTGLFAAGPGRDRVARVGDVRQDIMGFSVGDGSRFLGSGHPAPDQALPPSLGLIASRDGGRSWKPVSLLGEADFHVLRAAGRRVYGFDGLQGRFLASGDGGRTWERRAVPAAMFDLAIDPADASRLLASTERGLFASADGGRRWRPRAADLAGLLAWPRTGPVLVDGEGGILRSADGGRTWKPAGRVDGPPGAVTASGDDLYVALHDGTVVRSGDGGRTWAVRARP